MNCKKSNKILGTGAEDADDAPGLEEEGAGAQHCQLPQRGAEEPVQAGVARCPERHQTTRGWWLLVRGQGSIWVM